MRKMIIFSIWCLLLLSSVAHARSGKYTIAGQIHFEKTGMIYIKIVTRTQFEDKEKSPFRLTIRIDKNGLNTKKVPFMFQNVPKGTYGIMVFEDTNENKKFDMGMFGPKEPWGMYRPVRPMFRKPGFDEFAFSLKKDITNINIKLK